MAAVSSRVFTSLLSRAANNVVKSKTLKANASHAAINYTSRRFMGVIPGSDFIFRQVRYTQLLSYNIYVFY